MRYVLKYGGSSVATIEQIKNIASYLKKRHLGGDSLVVVVSAMGKTTNQLIELAKSVNEAPNAREMDMLLGIGEMQSASLLAMALQSIGVKSVALTGFQAGVKTDNKHRKASIMSIDVSRILEKLRTKHVVIIAGFQGIDELGDITTIGRGGSDTTAVALASCLKCDCEIYTDVDAVATMDPKCIENVKKISKIDIDSMLDTALNGAKVLDARCLQVAKKYGTSIYLAKSLESERRGTDIIASKEMGFEDMPISSIAKIDDICLIRVMFAKKDAKLIINVIAEMGGEIIYLSNIKDQNELIFKLQNEEQLNEFVSSISRKIRLTSLEVIDKLCKLTLILPNIQKLTEIQKKALTKLMERGIVIEKAISNGNNIAIYLYEKDKLLAMKILANTFNLLESNHDRKD